MDAAEVLRRLGSVATWAALQPVVSRAELRAALEAGRVVRLGRGRYALPAADVARRAAHRVNGVVSHLSAALYWGLEVKLPPAAPVVTVPRGRKLDPARRAGIDVRWRTLVPDQLHRGAATLPVPTVVDCARTLPFDEALAVADSALRSGLVTRGELVAAAAAAPRVGRAAALRVVRSADARADNPFESVVRAIALGVPGLVVVPQARVAGVGCPDLYDERLGIVIECDSFGFHAERADLQRDCNRYNACAVRDLVVVRFTWEDAMFRPEHVRRVLLGVVELRTELRAGRASTADRSA